MVNALRAAGPPEGPIRIQCNPKSLEPKLGQALPLSFQLDPRTFCHILDVVRLENDRFLYSLRASDHISIQAPDTPSDEGWAWTW